MLEKANQSMLSFIEHGDDMYCNWYNDNSDASYNSNIDLSAFCDHRKVPLNQIAPFGYGLVYIDYLRNYFWWMQDYTLLDGISPSMIKHYGHLFGSEYIEQVAKRISSHVEFDEESRSKEIDIKFNSAEELLLHIKTVSDQQYSRYMYDFKGWDTRRFNNSPDGAKAFLHAIQTETDVRLTGNELETWNNYIYAEDSWND